MYTKFECMRKVRQMMLECSAQDANVVVFQT
jgi:hypothetical protein